MEYVIHAVHFVADNGYMFLPLYRYDLDLSSPHISGRLGMAKYDFVEQI